MYRLTEKGRKKAARYIAELQAKRKEILDAGKDTADDTSLPTVEDIEDDINFIGLDGDGEYLNGWGVTDNYEADGPLSLLLGKDIEKTSDAAGKGPKKLLADYFRDWEEYVPDDGDAEHDPDGWWVKVDGRIYRATFTVSPGVPDSMCHKVEIGGEEYYY